MPKAKSTNEGKKIYTTIPLYLYGKVVERCAKDKLETKEYLAKLIASDFGLTLETLALAEENEKLRAELERLKLEKVLNTRIDSKAEEELVTELIEASQTEIFNPTVPFAVKKEIELIEEESEPEHKKSKGHPADGTYGEFYSERGKPKKSHHVENFAFKS